MGPKGMLLCAPGVARGAWTGGASLLLRASLGRCVKLRDRSEATDVKLEARSSSRHSGSISVSA